VTQTEEKVGHWHIGSNVPGYLPESDVFCFDGTEFQAANYVWEDANDALENEFEVHECDDPDCSPENPTCKDIPYLVGNEGDLEISLENRHPNDLGVVFWAMETERTEDCEKETE